MNAHGMELMLGLHKELTQICLGKQVKFDLSNLGIQSGDSTAKNHVACVDGGLIEKYRQTSSKDQTKFREYVITHDLNYPVKDEDGDSYFIGDSSSQMRETIKREIIYVEI